MIFVESKHIEYKRELSDSLEKEVVAFLNSSEGGVIYIGIDSKAQKVIGVSDADDIQLKIKDRIKYNIAPSIMGLFDVLLERQENKDIIKINIASGSEKPYHLKRLGMSEKGCFIRVGSSSEPMPARLIEEQFAKRARNSIRLIRSPKRELSFEQLKIYYQETDLKLNDKFASNLELLTPDSEYNYAAYLLSDHNGVSIKVAKYKDKTRVYLTENNEYGYCSLVKAVKQVLSKLEVENRTFTRITSRERQEKKMIDPTALREAVINAIVHNDYSNEVPPKFELFSDRLEITSAGGLPHGLSKDEFLLGFSVPRNKELMRVFKDLDLVEYLGSGIPRILEKYDPSIFLFTENFFRITFMFEEEIPQLEEDSGLVDGLVDGLVETQRRVLQILKVHPFSSKQELAEQLKISTTAIDKNIKALKGKGLLRRIGHDKGGHWEVVLNEENFTQKSKDHQSLIDTRNPGIQKE